MSTTSRENALHAWVVAGSGLAASKVIWEDQAGPRPQTPYISMQISSVAPNGQQWVYVEDNPLVIADDTVEAVDTGADTLTLTAHGLLDGDGPIRFTTTGTLPTGLALATDYWVIKVDADTIRVASTFLNSLAATQIDITGAGAGTHTLVDTSETERVGEEITHNALSSEMATLSLQCFSDAATGDTRPDVILRAVQMASRLPSVHAALMAAGIGLAIFEPITPISGVIGTSQWEPRAVTAVQFHQTSEASETSNYIATAEITRET